MAIQTKVVTLPKRQVLHTVSTSQTQAVSRITLASKGTAALVTGESLYSATNPQTVIRIMVDTAYVAACGGGVINSGVYMYDNRTDNGSSGQGGDELKTAAKRLDYIGFYIDAINPNRGDQVAIMGFTVSSGDVFGSGGFPMQKAYDYWVGEAENASNSTYQITASVTTNDLSQRQIFFTWDPFIVVQ